MLITPRKALARARKPACAALLIVGLTGGSALASAHAPTAGARHAKAKTATKRRVCRGNHACASHRHHRRRASLPRKTPGTATVPTASATSANKPGGGTTTSSGSTSTAGATAPSSPAAPAARTWKSGVFSGYGPQGDLQFGTWRGAAVQTATDYIGSDNWSQIENPAWAINAWAAAPSVQPDLSVALWPATGGSLAEAASGAYNQHFVALAQNLVAGGLGGVNIRLGWEFNGTWYRWSVATQADAANFAAAWQQIVTAMRSVPGAKFGFDWAPTLNAGGVNPALSYPGDAYVSDIGMDVYDWNPAPNATAAQRWNALVNNGYGLAWQSSFAAAHGKPIAFPEWGLADNQNYSWLSGGDDTTFVQNMYNWFVAHHPAFENYFNSDDGSGLFSGITTGNGLFPNATALYRKLYSQ